MKRFLTGMAFALFFTGANGQAEEFRWEIKEVPTPKNLPALTDPILLNLKSQPEVIVDGDISLDEIINLIKQVWQVIENNKPVVTVQYDYANAVPKGVDPSSDLAGFSNLMSKSYDVNLVNGFGQKVVELSYTLVHMYNGNVDGKGRYLENVTVLPTKVNVLWGYNLNMAVKRITTVNTGTREDPIASLVMQLEYVVKTPLKEMQSRSAFQFRGDSAKVIAIQ